MKPHIAYIYRGSVERGTGNGYQWRDGFSEAAENGAVTFPWMTARECQADAKKRGAVARFIHHTTTNKTATDLYNAEFGDLRISRRNKFKRR